MIPDLGILYGFLELLVGLSLCLELLPVHLLIEILPFAGLYIGPVPTLLHPLNNFLHALLLDASLSLTQLRCLDLRSLPTCHNTYLSYF